MVLIQEFKVPFPIVAFCPDLDIVLMYNYLKCILYSKCDDFSWSESMQKITTVRAGASICWKDGLQHIDQRFLHELISSDHKNTTLADHLEHFLDPNWTEKHSFCKSAQSEDGRTESYATDIGLCFILNPGDGVFNKQRYVS